jgi:cell division protease FtsH
MTQSELESHIQVLMAGTIAEELVYTDISTGAQNDLERATAIARSMVMEYGMSRLGRINYRGAARAAFLAIPGSDEGTRGFSERTAREIDEEVRRIIEEAIEKVRRIVEKRRAALEALAKRLIEVESVDAAELRRIIEQNSPGPLVVPGTAGTRRATGSADASDKLGEAPSERQGS